MNFILKELHELIGSEEKNRNEAENLFERYSRITENSFSTSTSFGVAASALEKELEEFIPLFDQYAELTSNGDYLKAREIVLNLTHKGDQCSIYFRIFHSY